MNTSGDRIALSLRAERAARRLLFLACRRGVRGLTFQQVRWLGTLLGEVQFRLARASRRRMVHELAAILDPSKDSRAIDAILREAFRVNNAVVLEILKILDTPQDRRALISQVEITGIEILQAAIASGRGVILLGMHMGNSAALLVRMAEYGIPLSAVYREALMMDPGFFTRGIGQYGVEAILANQGSSAYRGLLSALRRRRVVYICIDQGVKLPRDGVVLRFLGKDMPMPSGPAHAARRSNTQVLPIAAVAAHPKWHFEIHPPMSLSENGSPAADLEEMLRTSERLILRNPQLWGWHQRRWRHYPLAPLSNSGDVV